MTLEAYKKLRSENPLQGACLNLTDACNLACSYCFTHPAPRNMSLQTAKDSILYLLRTLPDKDRLTIAFFGGEPMLRYDEVIVPLVNWSRDLNQPIDFSITTNCTLFTEERLQWLQQNRIAALLSLDGAPATQDGQRRTVNNQPSSQLIPYDLLVKYNPRSTFRATVTPASVDNLFNDYLFARNNNFYGFYFVPNSLESWTAEETLKLTQAIFEIGLSMYDDILHDRFPILVSPILSSFIKLSNLPPEYTNVTCGLGITSCGIGTDGSIYGCQEHSTYDHNSPFFIGDIYNDIDIERHMRLLDLHAQAKKPVCIVPERCDKCLNRPHCFNMSCPSRTILHSMKAAPESLVHCIYTDALMNVATYILAIAKTTKNTKLYDFLEKHVLTADFSALRGHNGREV